MGQQAQDLELKKQPPHSQEAEEALLGSIILNNKVLIDVVGIISPEDFYRPQNKTIYEHITRIWEKGHPVDVLTLQESLKNDQALDRIGGPVYIDQLFDRVPSSKNAPYYAKIIHEMATKRRIVDLGVDLVDYGQNSKDSAEEIIDTIGQKFTELAYKEARKKNRPMSEIVDELYRELERRKGEKGFSGLDTGYEDINKILGGFQKSDFIILAARPSVGKTALALNIAQRVATNHKRVIFFSLEMSAEQLALRLLATISGISTHKIRKGELSEHEWKTIQDAIDELDKLDIFINDSSSITPLGIRADARRMALDRSEEHIAGIDLIVVDYIQLISPGGKRYDGRVQEVSEISRSLKSLGRELNVPILALSQLSRESTKQGRKPNLADLRESGALEQDADVVMFLHQTEEAKKLSLDKNIETELIVAKHRNGPTGTLTMQFNRLKTEFCSETTLKEGAFDDEPFDEDASFDDLDDQL